jgi:hypothetical protein
VTNVAEIVATKDPGRRDCLLRLLQRIQDGFKRDGHEITVNTVIDDLNVDGGAFRGMAAELYESATGGWTKLYSEIRGCIWSIRDSNEKAVYDAGALDLFMSV